MPTYTYRCEVCGAHTAAFRRVEDRHDAPEHCARGMSRTIEPAMIAGAFQAYTTPCYDQETGRRMRIANREEHRAFLARNRLEEIGNDRRFAPKCAEELAEIRARHEADARAAPMVDIPKLQKEGWITEDLTS